VPSLRRANLALYLPNNQTCSSLGQILSLRPFETKDLGGFAHFLQPKIDHWIVYVSR
jgi:hypothetical protein